MRGWSGFRQLGGGGQGQPARVKSGSGAVEKNLEVKVKQRLKRQGRSWNPERAERLLQLKLLMNEEGERTAWWQKPIAFSLSKPP
ncbi:MAG: hypothetical protein N2689_14035 [Verrucomicrobiae bacterium]|nr:hypothetical protein [Verrucomicrobiae bacterium]